MLNQGNAISPTVFISYAHPSEPNQKKWLLDRVLALADSLRRDGINALIDQYEVSPPERWPRWMLNQIEEANFVLVVCTEEYNRRFRGNESYGTGRGVTWEGGIIVQELYNSQGRNSKFIPVTLRTDDSDFIPTPLHGVKYYELNEFRLDVDNDYTNLYRHLTEQPDTQLPPLGSIVTLPKRRRQTDFQLLRVFISYAHPSELNQKRELLDRVLTFSGRLRLDGIDCYIDQYLENIPEDWIEWVQEQVAQADFVLVVCTKEYHRRFHSSDSHQQDLTYQGSVVIDQLYADRNSKFIPITFNSNDLKYVPNPLGDPYDEVDKHENYERLYRYLVSQPSPQTLHKPSALSLKHPRQSFLSGRIHNSTLPERGRCNVIGREQEIGQLIEKISPSNPQIIHIIQGVGGLGKTSLAIEVSHRCLEARENSKLISDIPLFDAFIFISFKSAPYPTYNTFKTPTVRAETPADICATICTTLDEKRADKSPPEKLKQISYEAMSKQPTLLIVDNMETLSNADSQEVLNFLSGVPESTKVIITTREGFNPSSSIVVERLQQTDIADAIKTESKLRGIDVNEEEIAEIDNSAGGNFLAIKGLLDEKQRQGNLNQMLDPENGAVEELLEKCVGKQINDLENRNKLSYRILIALIVLNGLSSKNLLLEVAGPAIADQRQTDYSTALLELERLCLIVKQENDCYSIEPTTRKYIRLQWKKINPDTLNAMERRKLYYYLKLTDQHGGEDIGNWKEQYEPLRREWDNIKQVLREYRDQSNWGDLSRMWMNVDRYVDLGGYWQDRLEWWTVIEKNNDNPKIKAQALAEKAWSKLLIGNTIDDYTIAREWLKMAQDRYNSGSDDCIKANIANYSATAWKNDNEETSRYWLEQESIIIEDSNGEIDDSTRSRYRARNLYFRATIEDDWDVSEQQFRKVIELCEQINWLRFHNYARNDLADILVSKSSLEEAEDLLVKGLKFSVEMEEERRIALYHFSLAKLYRRKLELYEPESPTDIRNSEYKVNLDKNTDEAKTRFKRLGMLPELEKINKFAPDPENDQ